MSNTMNNPMKFGPQMPDLGFAEALSNRNPFAQDTIPDNPFGGFPVVSGGQLVKAGEDPRAFYDFKMDAQVEQFRMGVDDSATQARLARIYQDAVDQKIIMIDPVTKQYDPATASYVILAVYYKVSWIPKTQKGK